MLISVFRLLIASSLRLLFALSLTHIPRIFVLEIVKALRVLGKGDVYDIYLFRFFRDRHPDDGIEK